MATPGAPRTPRGCRRSRSIRIFGFDPFARTAGAVCRTLALADDSLKPRGAGVAEHHITLRVLHSAGRPDGPYVAMLATVALRTSMGSRRRSAPVFRWPGRKSNRNELTNGELKRGDLGVTKLPPSPTLRAKTPLYHGGVFPFLWS